MAKKATKVITLFDSYNGYDFEEEKAALQECNPNTTITDDDVWDSIHDCEDEDWCMCKHYLEDTCGDSKVLVKGSIGTWRGNFEGAKIFDDILDALTACIKDCDYFKVEQLGNRTIKVTSSHHDGTNEFYLKKLTERGWQVFDSWNYGVNSKLTNLSEYDLLAKLWADSHYSVNFSRVW